MIEIYSFIAAGICLPTMRNAQVLAIEINKIIAESYAKP
jgi:hypothetical protein